MKTKGPCRDTKLDAIRRDLLPSKLHWKDPSEKVQNTIFWVQAGCFIQLCTQSPQTTNAISCKMCFTYESKSIGERESFHNTNQLKQSRFFFNGFTDNQAFTTSLGRSKKRAASRGWEPPLSVLPGGLCDIPQHL